MYLKEKHIESGTLLRNLVEMILSTYYLSQSTTHWNWFWWDALSERFHVLSVALCGCMSSSSQQYFFWWVRLNMLFIILDTLKLLYEIDVFSAVVNRVSVIVLYSLLSSVCRVWVCVWNKKQRAQQERAILLLECVIH